MSDSGMEMALAMLDTLISEKGYASISNYELAMIAARKLGLWDGECFLIHEGFSQHIIATLEGAKQLRENLIRQHAYYVENGEQTMVLMNVIARCHLNVVIDVMEGKDV